MGDFQQLAVWNRSHQFALSIHRLTAMLPISERYGLGAQMRRAAVSIVSNIAEGCGRQGDRELARFLRMARGSVRELECQLLLARDLEYIPREVWSHHSTDSQEISKMLSGLIKTVRSGRTRKSPSP